MHTSRRPHGPIRALVPAAILAAAPPALAQSALFVVDFEGVDEGTEVNTQFSTVGITFGMVGAEALPIIAVEGNPVVAYNGGGADSPMSSGVAGLTDPLVDGQPFEPTTDIEMTFDPPVTSVRMFIIDIDATETFTVRAFDGLLEIDSQSRSSGQAGTGNGTSSEFFVSGDTITSVIVDVPDPPQSPGFAIDFVSFTRPCGGDACGALIEVAQESTPNAGDFDDNRLGSVLIHPAAASAATFYAYDVPAADSWNGPSLSPVSNRSHLLVGDTDDGASLFVVHDAPGDGSGGTAEMRLEIIGDPDGACRTVEDDPLENKAGAGYTGDPGDMIFAAAHDWGPCCTDGLALSRLEGPWSVILEFTDVDGNSQNDPIGGLADWAIYSSDGSTIQLTLELDRRVRLQLIPTCIGDTDRNGSIDVDDLTAVILDWGCLDPADPCAPLCSGDVNEDGVVDVDDLTSVILNWGPCG